LRRKRNKMAKTCDLEVKYKGGGGFAIRGLRTREEQGFIKLSREINPDLALTTCIEWR